jgi:hypothetical protein
MTGVAEGAVSLGVMPYPHLLSVALHAPDVELPDDRSWSFCMAARDGEEEEAGVMVLVAPALRREVDGTMVLSRRFERPIPQEGALGREPQQRVPVRVEVEWQAELRHA